MAHTDPSLAQPDQDTQSARGSAAMTAPSPVRLSLGDIARATAARRAERDRRRGETIGGLAGTTPLSIVEVQRPAP